MSALKSMVVLVALDVLVASDALIAAGVLVVVVVEALVAITFLITGPVAGTFRPPGVSTGTCFAATGAEFVSLTFLRAAAGGEAASAFALRFFSGVLRQFFGSLRMGMPVAVVGLDPVRLEPPFTEGGEGPPVVALRAGVDGATAAGVDAVKLSQNTAMKS